MRLEPIPNLLQVHSRSSLLAGGSVTPAPLSGAINTTRPELSLSYNGSADLLYEGGVAQTISCRSNPCKHGSPER